MPLYLARFPIEILVNIFKRVPTLNIYLATYLCGNRLIKAKAHQGAVTSVHLAAQSLQKLGLKFLADFRGLVCVSIDCIELEGKLNLHELPPNIRELEIRGDCANWLAAKPHPEFCTVPSNMLFHENESMPFNFKRHFHDLRHLRLQCRCERLNRRLATTVPMTLLIQCLLPPSLRTLSISHLAQIDPIYWGNLKEPLEILNLHSKIQMNLLERIISVAPQVRFKHLQLLEPVSDPSLIQKIPAKTLSMRINNMTPELLSELVKLFPLPAAESSTCSNPQLTAVTTIKWSITPKERRTPGSVQFPPALNSIEDLNSYDAVWTNFNALPSGITKLKATTDSLGALVLPSKLKELELTLTSDAASLPIIVSSLPTSLTSAHFMLPKVPDWSPELSSAFPKSLTYLQLHISGAAVSCYLPASFFISLPQTLTGLQINAPCLDSTLVHVPKSITNLVLGRIEISGALYSSTETLFNYADIGYLRRLVNGAFHYKAQISCDKDWNESFKRTPTYSVLKPDWLPASLTRIQIGSSNGYGHVKQWPALNLPNLTALQIPTYFDFPLQNCTVPSLTLLSICKVVYYDNFIADKQYPTSITHLQYVLGAVSDDCIPDSLKPQIRIFEAKTLLLSTIRLMPLLESADIDWNISHDCDNESNIDLIPKTITSLTIRVTYLGIYTPELRCFLAKLPHVTSINIKSHTCCVPESDLLSIPTRIKSITCQAVSISDPLSYLPFPENTFDGDSFDFVRSVVPQLKLKFPFLHFGATPTVHFPLLSAQHIKKLTQNWPETLSKATFGGGIEVSPRFGRLLPRNSLTSLDLLGGSDINFASAPHLPPTLTELKICSRKFTLAHYKLLPRGLQTLHLKAGKFLDHHARSMPESLQNFTLEFSALGERSLSLLPCSLEHLALPSLRRFHHLYYGLPSNLKTISINLLLQVKFDLLPESLEDIRLWPTHIEKPTPKDEFLRKLTPNELLSYLQKVKA